MTRGRGAIGVLMDDKESMQEHVAAVLKANHAQMVHDWGRLTTERLGVGSPIWRQVVVSQLPRISMQCLSTERMHSGATG